MTKQRLKPEKEGGKAGLPVFFIILASAGLVYYFYPGHDAPHRGHDAPHRSDSKEVEIEKTAAVRPAGISPAAGMDNFGDASRLNEAATEKVVSVANLWIKPFNEGDYFTASILLKKALADSPDDVSLKGNLAQSLSHIASGEFKNGDLRRSKELYMEAAGFDKENPGILKGLAKVEMELGEFTEAAAALAHFKNDKEAETLLKSVYYALYKRESERGNSREGALWLEKALRLTPADASLMALYKKEMRESSMDEGLTKKEGSHFIVRYEGGENAVSGHVIGILLEEAYYKIGAEIGYYPQDMITAVLYSQQTFRVTTRSPSWAGALYDGRIKLPAGGITGRTNLLEKVLFHEYTHAVVHRLSGGRAPVWLNEGLAQHMEGEKESEYGEIMERALRKGMLSLKRLEGPFTGFREEEAEITYAVSLSATEYLIREFGLSSVTRIFEGLRNGMTINEVFSVAVFLSYDTFEERWKDYVKKNF